MQVEMFNTALEKVRAGLEKLITINDFAKSMGIKTFPTTTNGCLKILINEAHDDLKKCLEAANINDQKI